MVDEVLTVVTQESSAIDCRGALDVSTTLQGAGGLLMIQDGSAEYFPIYDGARNIVGLYNESGGIAAAYEYDAFGRIVNQSGSYAASNPFRFSTKYTDEDTDLVYYGLRYYNPKIGRFINRDPSGEAGGINLNAFVGNNPVNHWDYLGMYNVNEDDPEEEEDIYNFDGGFLYEDGNGHRWQINDNGDIFAIGDGGASHSGGNLFDAIDGYYDSMMNEDFDNLMDGMYDSTYGLGEAVERYDSNQTYSSGNSIKTYELDTFYIVADERTDREYGFSYGTRRHRIFLREMRHYDDWYGKQQRNRFYQLNTDFARTMANIYTEKLIPFKGDTMEWA